MKHYWRYVSGLLTLPVFVLAICFALGNRGPTIISLWPVGIEMALPIYLLALAPLAIGLVAGALIQWVAGLRHQIAAQRLGKEASRLRTELAELRAQAAAQSAPSSAAASARNPLRMIAGLRARL